MSKSFAFWSVPEYLNGAAEYIYMEPKPILGILLITLVAVVVISGCVQEGQPQGTQETQQSQPQTEINLENNVLSVKIHPTEGNKISGIVTVTFESVPSEAGKILVMLSPQDMEHTDDPFSEPNVVAQFLEPDTKEAFVDTTKVENGVYNLAVTVSPEVEREGYPWIAVVQTQVLVNNE